MKLNDTKNTEIDPTIYTQIEINYHTYRRGKLILTAPNIEEVELRYDNSFVLIADYILL